MTDEDARATALRCAAAMWSADACSRQLGMALVEVEPGRAVVEMPIEAEMTNGHGIGHGGVIFALADSAFGFAANSRDRRHVAHTASILFLRPVAAGSRLRAEALERTLSGRSGIVDVTVTDEMGEVVAEFRGVSRTTGDAVLGADGDDG